MGDKGKKFPTGIQFWEWQVTKNSGSQKKSLNNAEYNICVAIWCLAVRLRLLKCSLFRNNIDRKNGGSWEFPNGVN